MLVIRKKQMEAFDLAARAEAVVNIRQHVRKHFAALVKDVPDERLETVVDRMIDAAKARGLVRMNEVLLYVNLGVVFGERFLQRRELEWLRQIMDDEAVGPPLARVRKAHAEAVKRLEAKS